MRNLLEVKRRIEAQQEQFGDQVATLKGEPLGPHGVLFAKAYEDQSLIIWHKHYPGKQVYVTRQLIHQDPRANTPLGKYELDVCIAKIDYRFIVCRAWVMDMIQYEVDKVRFELGLMVKMNRYNYDQPERTIVTKFGHTYGTYYFEMTGPDRRQE
jgi:hypothetical protein